MLWRINMDHWIHRHKLLEFFIFLRVEKFPIFFLWYLKKFIESVWLDFFDPVLISCSYNQLCLPFHKIKENYDCHGNLISQHKLNPCSSFFEIRIHAHLYSSVFKLLSLFIFWVTFEIHLIQKIKKSSYILLGVYTHDAQPRGKDIRSGSFKSPSAG
jgi:hypothetical protein